MKTQFIHAFYGTGKGKTSAAVGQALRGVEEGETVTIIQFLKGKNADEFRLIEKLEPDVKIFRFDKSESYYRDLTIEEKEEEKINILNGFNYARKVIETGESAVIVLDELLGLLDLGILDVDQIKELLTMEGDYKRLYITGNVFPEELFPYVNVISEIQLKKDDLQ